MDTASRLQGAVQSITSIFSRKTKENAPPQLSNPVRYPFGEFEFQLQALAGQTVELQITRDFRHWETLGKLAPAKDASVVSDRKAGNYPALFYRAVMGGTQSNYVGFVSFEIPPGYSMVTNPLHAASNQISDLFPLPPNGSTISKFSLITFSLTKNTFTNGKWTYPADTLLPGEGALFLNPSNNPVFARFVGEVPQKVQTVPLQPGTTIRSSPLPLAGRLDTDLAFPIEAGDVISLYSNQDGKYHELKFTDNGWLGEPPNLRLGEAFWIAKNTPALWSLQLPTDKK
jgi:hypothetical protein